MVLKVSQGPEPLQCRERQKPSRKHLYLVRDSA
jgi:hypothetical protein